MRKKNTFIPNKVYPEVHGFHMRTRQDYWCLSWYLHWENWDGHRVYREIMAEIGVQILQVTLVVFLKSNCWVKLGWTIWQMFSSSYLRSKYCLFWKIMLNKLCLLGYRKGWAFYLCHLIACYVWCVLHSGFMLIK